jgi:glycosyltransferase involved in cell wall biosynthesis
VNGASASDRTPVDRTAAADPLITVIMPTYKRAHVIARAIRTVLAQSFPLFELLVVDDASPDDTSRVVQTFHDPRVRYHRLERNGGVSRARNAGIAAAGPTRYLAYLDDDDEWAPDKLELQLAVFGEGGPDLGVVGCGRVDRHRQGSETFLPSHRGDIFEDVLARRAKGYGANSILVRRSDPEVLYDEGIRCLEDAEYMLRLARKWRVDFVPKALVTLHRDDDNPHLWNAANSLEGHLQVLEKYRDEIVSRPHVHRYYCFCIARELWALGRTSECREWLDRATSTGRHSRLRVWRAATLMGNLGLRLCGRLLPVTPPA